MPVTSLQLNPPCTPARPPPTGLAEHLPPCPGGWVPCPFTCCLCFVYIHLQIGDALSWMGKKRPISILQKEKLAAREPTSKRRKAEPQSQQHQHEKRPKLLPTSRTHQHASAAIKRLLEADANRRGGERSC